MGQWKSLLVVDIEILRFYTKKAFWKLVFSRSLPRIALPFLRSLQSNNLLLLFLKAVGLPKLLRKSKSGYVTRLI